MTMSNAVQRFFDTKAARQKQIQDEQRRQLLGQMLMGGDAGNLAMLDPQAYMMGRQFQRQERQGKAEAEQNALIQDLRAQYAQTQDPEVFRQLVAIDPQAAQSVRSMFGDMDEAQATQAINQATALARLVRTNPEQATAYFNENLANNPAFESLADEFEAGDYEGIINGLGVGITALGGQKAYEEAFGEITGPDIGTYNPRDYTVESFTQFTRTGDPSVLERYEPSRTVEIGGVPHVFNPANQEWQPVRVPRGGVEEEVTTETVAESEAEIAATRETAVQEARSEVERQQGAEQAIQRSQEQITTFNNTIDQIDTAIDQADSFGATGFMGNLLRSAPGTNAYDLKNNILTIKANIGFDRLQRMRELSPTGGALGNVANQELDALQATIASLDTAQSKDQLIRNLEKVREHYQKWRDNQEKYIEQIGSSISEQQEEQTPVNAADQTGRNAPSQQSTPPKTVNWADM